MSGPEHPRHEGDPLLDKSSGRQPREGMPLLGTEGLSCGYPTRPLVRQLDLELAPGQALGVVGANGTGKTTLLRTLAGLLPPLAGRVLLGEETAGSLSPRRRALRVALLPQEDQTDGSLTVKEMVELGRTPHLGLWGRLQPADRQAIQGALAACGLTDLAHRRLDQISGGERQRARIAMTLAQQSPLLLLDEPVNHLDLRRRYEFYLLLARLRQQLRLGVVLVVHDLREAFAECDRVLVLGADGADRAVEVSGKEAGGRRALLARAFGVPEEWVGL